MKNMDSSDIVIPDIVCEAVDLANTVDDITRDVCSRGEALVCSPYKGPVGQPPTKRRKVVWLHIKAGYSFIQLSVCSLADCE